MAYQSGNDIIRDHYNIFASGTASGVMDYLVPNVNQVWTNGPGGVGGRGYGQQPALAPVYTGGEVTAIQWAGLINRINTSAAHQGTALSPMVPPVTGNLVSAISVLENNIIQIVINRFSAAATGTVTSHPAQYTSPWETSVKMTHTIRFDSYENLRYFVNAGGHIKLSFSRSGGVGSTKDQTWTALASACGTILITSVGNLKTIAGTEYDGVNKIGGSGTPQALTNWAGLISLNNIMTDQLLFRQYDTSAGYSFNHIMVYGNTNATVVDGPFNEIIFTTWFRDDDYNDGTFVSGTLETNLDIIQPSNTYLSNTWGTPTVTKTVTGS